MVDGILALSSAKIAGMWLGLGSMLVGGLLTGCGEPAALAGKDHKDHEVASPPRPGPFLRVLGTAQDGGLPHAACNCERCDLARRDPHQARRIASLALVLPSQDQIYLIDATPDVRQQLDALVDVRRPPPDRVDRAPIDGVLLTHAHIGHYLGLAFFGFEAIHARDLAVYCTPRMAAFLRANGPWSQLVELGNLALHEVEPGSRLALAGGVEVMPFNVPHRDEYSDTVGFRLRGPQHTVFYVPDTDAWERWDPPLLDALEGVDVALLDGTFFSLAELPGRDMAAVKHPLISTSLELLGERVRAGELRVFFTHLNHSNPALEPDSAARRLIEERGFGVLEDGQELPL